MQSTGLAATTSPLTIPDHRHEAFRDIIDRFGVLLARQAELRAELPSDIIGSVHVDEDRFLNGDALVTGMNPDELTRAFTIAARWMWPLTGELFPALADNLTILMSRLETNADWTDLCLRAVVHGEAQALDLAASQAGVRPDFLLMALRAAYAPCIAALRPALLALAPAELWRRPYCPVCGSDPDLGVLENHPEPSEFLVSKSGEIWHHCPVCTHRWRFVRMICPGCGNQDHERLTRFSLSDTPSEQIYACEECRQYLPCLDRVEHCDSVDYDLLALSLVHLDAVAQSRGYTPLSPAPWTALGLAEAQAKAS